MKKAFVRRMLLAISLVVVLSLGTFVFADTNGSVVASGTCGENATWTLDDAGTLTVSGTGEMADYDDDNKSPWHIYSEEIKEVIIKNGITSIGAYAFFDENDEIPKYNYLESITIPKSVTSIGENAFNSEDAETESFIRPLILCYKDSVAAKIAENENRYYVYIDGSKEENTLSGTRGNNLSWELNKLNQKLTIITTGDMPAFVLNRAPWWDYRAYISSVEILGRTTNIGEEAFANCGKIKTCIVPNSVTLIENHAFADCYQLEKITMPNVTTIEDAAFDRCKNLVEISMPNVTTIGECAFSDCGRLKEINLPNVTTIEGYAFAHCTGLNSVSMPKITRFGYSVFLNCSGLKDLILPNCGHIDLGWDLNLDSLVVPYKVESLGVECVKNIYVYNPNMEMDGIALYSDGTIYGYVGSTAEKYATENAFNFVDITTVEHNHIYGDEKIEEATCTESGYKYSICNLCGQMNVNSTIPSTDHTVVTDKAVTATCTTEGKTEGSHCSVCNTVIKAQETVQATGHVKKTVTTKATLSKNGKVVTKCTTCDKTLSTKTIYYAKTIKMKTTEYTYNGKVKSPTLIVKDSKGKTISSKNYTVTKAKGRKSVGKYTYKITFKNQYKGTKAMTFTINPKKPSITKKPTVAKKAFTVKWKKVSEQATGYEVMYSTSKNFTKKTSKTVTVKSYKTTSKKISKLKAKKTYYVKVRTYKTVNGKKYYSGWSAVKSVKTK